MIKYYGEAEKIYSESVYKDYSQKYLYIIYLKSLFPKRDIPEFIYAIESTLKEYKAGEEISEARKLIQKGYKEFLDNRIKEIFQ